MHRRNKYLKRNNLIRNNLIRNKRNNKISKHAPFIFKVYTIAMLN